MAYGLRNQLRDEVTYAAALNPTAILHSKEEKPPKGFEKFFRRDTDKKAKKKESKDEEKKQKEKEEEDLTEEEEAAESKKGKEGDGKSGEGDQQGKIKAFFFDPNNNPKNEALILLAAAIGAGYFVYNFKAPMKEIVYMEFLNDYLLQNRIK